MHLHLLPLLRLMPRGQISTYGDMACFLGVPNNSRQMGKILGDNQDPNFYPCYKVVGSDGALTGYSTARGLAEKAERLQKDGIKVLGSRVIELQKYRWQPKFHSYFLAIPLDEKNKKIFRSAVAKVQKMLPKDSMTFQQLETPHITLHHFGDLSLEEVARTVKRLKNYETQTASGKELVHKLTFQGLDFFGKNSQRTVGFFSCVEGKKQLISLQNDVMKKLHISEQRPFVSHLTLFRIKDPVRFAKLEKKVQALLSQVRFTLQPTVLRLYAAVGEKHQVPLVDFDLM